MSETRFIELEMKISHQEMAIEELQKVTFEQYRMIERLEKNLKLLTEQFKSFKSNENPIGPADEKPPHY